MDRGAIPPDPLRFVRACVRQGRIRWTHHATHTVAALCPVPIEAVVAAVDSFEVIEDYPHDKYLPSHLVRAEWQQTIFHLQVATEVQGDNVRIVTVYIPRPDEWDLDGRVRKEPK